MMETIDPSSLHLLVRTTSDDQWYDFPDSDTNDDCSRSIHYFSVERSLTSPNLSYSYSLSANKVINYSFYIKLKLLEEFHHDLDTKKVKEIILTPTIPVSNNNVCSFTTANMSGLLLSGLTWFLFLPCICF